MPDRPGPRGLQKGTINALANVGWDPFYVDQDTNVLRFLALNADHPSTVRKYAINATGRLLLCQTFVHRPDLDRPR